jgi:hypothetical protein
MNTDENNKDGIEEQKEDQLAPEKPSLEPFFDDIEEIAQRHAVKEFVFVFVKKGMDQPAVFWRNQNQDHQYDATALLAAVMRDMKTKIIQELDC